MTLHFFTLCTASAENSLVALEALAILAQDSPPHIVERLLKEGTLNRSLEILAGEGKGGSVHAAALALIRALVRGFRFNQIPAYGGLYFL